MAGKIGLITNKLLTNKLVMGFTLRAVKSAGLIYRPARTFRRDEF